MDVLEQVRVYCGVVLHDLKRRFGRERCAQRVGGCGWTGWTGTCPYKQPTIYHYGCLVRPFSSLPGWDHSALCCSTFASARPSTHSDFDIVAYTPNSLLPPPWQAPTGSFPSCLLVGDTWKVPCPPLACCTSSFSLPTLAFPTIPRRLVALLWREWTSPWGVRPFLLLCCFSFIFKQLPVVHHGQLLDWWHGPVRFVIYAVTLPVPFYACTLLNKFLLYQSIHLHVCVLTCILSLPRGLFCDRHDRGRYGYGTEVTWKKRTVCFLLLSLNKDGVTFHSRSQHLFSYPLHSYHTLLPILRHRLCISLQVV